MLARLAALPLSSITELRRDRSGQLWVRFPPSKPPTKAPSLCDQRGLRKSGVGPFGDLIKHLCWGLHSVAGGTDWNTGLAEQAQPSFGSTAKVMLNVDLFISIIHSSFACNGAVMIFWSELEIVIKRHLQVTWSGISVREYEVGL